MFCVCDIFNHVADLNFKIRGIIVRPGVVQQAMSDNRIYHVVRSALEVSPNDSLVSKVTQCLNVLAVINTHGVFAKPPDRPKQTFESSHPYEHNLDTKKIVKFSGASRLEVVFDSQCRTERQCDYLRFFCRGKHVGLEMYHGDSRELGNTWPDLVVDGDELEFTFHSDSNNNDWGYKFDVYAVFGSQTNSFYMLGQQLKVSLIHVICDLCVSSGALVIPSFLSQCFEKKVFPDQSSSSQAFLSLACDLMKLPRFRKAFEVTLSEVVASESPCESGFFDILRQFLHSEEQIYEILSQPRSVSPQSPPDWVPSIKGRVVPGVDWSWHDQDAGNVGTIMSIDHQNWICVRWDLGSTNFYRYNLDSKKDIRGYPLDAETSEPVKFESKSTLPKDWFLSVLSNLAFALFESSFDSSIDASLCSSQGDVEALSVRIIDFINSFKGRVISSCKSISCVESIIDSLVAKLVVHACFRHRMFESILFLSTGGSNQTCLLMLSNYFASDSFRAFFSTLVEKNLARFDESFACIWAACFTAIRDINAASFISHITQQRDAKQSDHVETPLNEQAIQLMKQSGCLIELLGLFVDSPHCPCKPPLTSEISESISPSSPDQVCVICDLPASLHFQFKCQIGHNNGCLGKFPQTIFEPAVPHAAKNIEKITASSSPDDTKYLCTGNLHEYWKSENIPTSANDHEAEDAHWIRLFVKPDVNPARLKLFCTGHNSEGFPKVINVRCASSESSLAQAVCRSATAESISRNMQDENDDASCKIIMCVDLNECCPDPIRVIDIQIVRTFRSINTHNSTEENSNFCIICGIAVEEKEDRMTKLARMALTLAAGNVRTDQIKQALQWISITQQDCTSISRLSKRSLSESVNTLNTNAAQIQRSHSMFAPHLRKATMYLIFNRSEICIPDDMDAGQNSILEDVMFVHMQDEEFYENVCACLLQVVRQNPHSSLHPSIITSMNRIVSCNFSLPAHLRSSQIVTRLEAIADSIIMLLALKSLENQSIDPKVVSLEILLTTVRTSFEHARAVLGGAPLHQLTVSALSRALIRICSDFNLLSQNHVWQSASCSEFLSSISSGISSTGARDSIASSMSFDQLLPIKNSIFDVLPWFISRFFELSKRVFSLETSVTVSSGASASPQSSDVDSTICEFQSIASILKLAFESLSSLGKCVDAVLRTLSASMVTSLGHNNGDVSIQLVRVLECRQNVLVTQKHISSLSGQCQTFESPHPYDVSSDTSHSIQFHGASRIRIKFDTRCSTMLGSDYVQFRQANEIVGNVKYHGGEDDSERYWLPLVVNGDQVEARFVSGPDAGTYWGYKFTATAQPASHWVMYGAIADNLMHLLNFAVASLLESDGSFVVPPSCYEFLKCDDSSPLAPSVSSTSKLPDDDLFCVDAKDQNGKWYQAFIVHGSAFGDMKSDHVKIHFMGWESKWDETILQERYDSHIRRRTLCAMGPNGIETAEDVLKKYPNAPVMQRSIVASSIVIYNDPFSQCGQALESLLQQSNSSCSRYRCHLARSIASAALEGSIHPLLLSCAGKFINGAFSANEGETMTCPGGIICENLPYHTLIVPLLASAIVAMNVPTLSVPQISKPVSSHIFNGIRGAVDRLMSALSLSSNAAFIRLIPAIEAVAVFMLQKQLPYASFVSLVEETESYFEALLSEDFEQSPKSHPENTDILFIALSSHHHAIRPAAAPLPSFSWEASQLSLLCCYQVCVTCEGNETSFSNIIDGSDGVFLSTASCSLPAYVFSSLPLDSYARASDNCFEINIFQGIEYVGLTTLSRSDLHIHPYLFEDSIGSYLLHFSSKGSRATLFHNGALVSVLPQSSSNVAQAVNIIYCPSKQTVTFTISQALTKWSHTFEGLPSSNVFLFAKLRGEKDSSKIIKWNAVAGTLQTDPSSKYFHEQVVAIRSLEVTRFTERNQS